MSFLRGSTGNGRQYRGRRLLELIPIETQVSFLAAAFLICAFVSGLNWSSSSGSQSNLLANPEYLSANSNQSYVFDCRSIPTCGPPKPAASNWDIRDFSDRTSMLWATTEHLPSTLDHGGHWMLQVTGSGAVGIVQVGTFSAIGARWSVWVFPVMGEVKACVGPARHSLSDPISCDTTAALGSWQKLS